jgi:hypothetical protein
LAVGERFQRFRLISIANPGLSLRSNRGAEISERLRRCCDGAEISEIFGVDATGLKLANAFGVNFKLRLYLEFQTEALLSWAIAW